MLFKPTEKDARALEARDCRFSFDRIKRAERDERGNLVFAKDRHGEPTRDLKFSPEVTVCTIVDSKTKRTIAVEEGYSEEEAFARALAASQDAPMPKSPAEVEAENVQLKRKIAEMESARAADAPAEVEAESSEPEAPAAETNEESPEPDLQGLRQEAEMLGIDVDGRWGADRLKQEIQKAESDGQAEIQSTLNGNE